MEELRWQMEREAGRKKQDQSQEAEGMDDVKGKMKEGREQDAGSKTKGHCTIAKTQSG